MNLGLRARLARRFGFRCVEFGAKLKGNVTVGQRLYVAAGAEIIANRGEQICIGDDCTILRGVLLHPYGGRIAIGNNVGINPYCVIYGHGGLEIGNDVMIAAACVIVPANHNFQRKDRPIRSQGLNCNGIIIEDDVWLGAGVRVLDGVRIGRGAIIGAGAVVTKDIPSFSIAVGVPAKVVSQRDGFDFQERLISEPSNSF